MENLRPEPESGQKQGGAQKPHWSLAANFWAAAVILFISTVVVRVILKKPVWVEMEAAVGVMAIAMFGFYTWILYHGVSFRNDETLKVEFSPFNGNLFSHTDPGIVADCGFAGLGEGGPLGCLAGLLIGVVLCAAGAIIGWLFSNLFLAGITILALPLFYIFKQSVFFVLRHSEECRGRLGAAMKYGAAYAFVKGSTLYLIIYAVHLLNVVIKPLFMKG